MKLETNCGGQVFEVGRYHPDGYGVIMMTDNDELEFWIDACNLGPELLKAQKRILEDPVVKWASAFFSGEYQATPDLIFFLNLCPNISALGIEDGGAGEILFCDPAHKATTKAAHEQRHAQLLKIYDSHQWGEWSSKT